MTGDAPHGEMPWLKAYPADVDWYADLKPEPMPDLFDRSIADYGDRPCCDFMGKVTTYAEIGALTDKAAKGLQEMGVGKDTRVGLFLPNSPYFIVFYFAALKTGATVVNYNPLYTVEEVARQVEDSGTSVMITLDLTVLLPKITEVMGRTDLKKVVVCPMTGILPFPKNLLFPLFKRKEVAKVPADERYVRFEEVTGNDGAYRKAEIDPVNDIAVFQYTGGTTGMPKAAMLTHANLCANTQQLLLWYTNAALGEERILAVLPFFHVFAMTVIMNMGLKAGALIILMPRFEMDATLKAIARTKPTVFPGVPTLFNAINNFDGIDQHDLSSLKFCISGGAPLPLEVKTVFEKRTGCILVEGYGLSECAPVATANPLSGESKENSIGIPLPGTRIEIRDLEDPDRLMPQGEAGEVCVIGPQVMKGYWNRPDETARTLRNGRLHTGDVAYLDDEGYAFIIDRIKDLIICSGYNVYPRVIEEAIYEHEAVAEVTVIGVPDDYRGEAPKAFVKLREGESLEEAGLMAFLEAKLSKIELPKAIEFRDELPKTMIGKLSKKELVAEEKAKAAGA